MDKKDEKQPSIYTMSLHDEIFLRKENIVITRVPGGWIYCTIYMHDEILKHMSSVFVQYSAEFKKGTDPKQPTK